METRTFVHLYERDVKRRQQRFRDTGDTISDRARHPDDDVGQRHGHLVAVDTE
jgi:hypothetical protein